MFTNWRNLDPKCCLYLEHSQSWHIVLQHSLFVIECLYLSLKSSCLYVSIHFDWFIWIVSFAAKLLSKTAEAQTVILSLFGFKLASEEFSELTSQESNFQLQEDAKKVFWQVQHFFFGGGEGEMAPWSAELPKIKTIQIWVIGMLYWKNTHRCMIKHLFLAFHTFLILKYR